VEIPKRHNEHKRRHFLTKQKTDFVVITSTRTCNVVRKRDVPHLSEHRTPFKTFTWYVNYDTKQNYRPTSSLLSKRLTASKSSNKTIFKKQLNMTVSYQTIESPGATVG